MDKEKIKSTFGKSGVKTLDRGIWYHKGESWIKLELFEELLKKRDSLIDEAREIVKNKHDSIWIEKSCSFTEESSKLKKSGEK